MNNRVREAFSHGKAFIPFITAGDPSLAVTEELVCAMEEAGADLIELGVPFSDPVAEGPVIQRADERALAAGATADRLFTLVQRIRRRSRVPLAFMTYVNPVFTYGTARFVQNCAETGVDALIVPDLPYEEREELSPACRESGVALVPLIAPTSRERIRMIAEKAEGFLYCVSSMGVTGVRGNIAADVADMVAEAKKAADIPCAVGFGISTPAQAAEMARRADGVIVGSAIVKLVAQYGEGCVPHVARYVRGMKAALK